MRNIVITGVSSGIGFHLANSLTLNNKVYGLSRKKPKIKNDNFIFLKTDLGNLKSLTSSLKKIKKVDVLINNAGITKSSKKNFLEKFKGKRSSSITSVEFQRQDIQREDVVKEVLDIYSSEKEPAYIYYDELEDNL